MKKILNLSRFFRFWPALLIWPWPAAAMDQVDEAREMSQMVVELYNQGQYQQALPLAELALELFEESVGPEARETATALSNLANLYIAVGRTGPGGRAFPPQPENIGKNLGSRFPGNRKRFK